jgi:hypothetical protein
MIRMTTLMGVGGLGAVLIVVWGTLRCASAPVARSDSTGAVAWRVMAFQRVPTAVSDRPEERYTFTLLLREQAGTEMTFTRVAQTVSALQVAPMAATQDGWWRLPPMGELQLPFRLVWSCPALSEPCSTAAGPRTGTFTSREPPIMAPRCSSPWRSTRHRGMRWRRAEQEAGVVTSPVARPSRGGAVDAGPPVSHYPAGHDPPQGHRNYARPSRRRPHRRPHGVGHDAPVSCPPPDHLGRGPDRWGSRADAGRGLTRAPRGALPGCTAGVPPPRDGGLAATARGGGRIQTIPARRRSAGIGRHCGTNAACFPPRETGALTELYLDGGSIQ